MLASAFTSFNNPYSYERTIRAVDVDLVVTGRGHFLAELTRIDLPHLWIQRGKESLSWIAHTALDKARSPIFFLSEEDDPPMRLSGMELSAGEMVVYSPGSTNYLRTSAACHWGTMSLTPEDLAAAGESLVGRELHAPRDTSIIRPSPDAFARLLRLHRSAASMARSTPELLAHPETAHALESALVHAMISCLTEHISMPETFGGRSHSVVMARFERALAAEPKRPLYLAEMCTATGISERTLRLCCREHLGMGPIRFLWLRRMHLARRQLLMADPRTTSVTAVAVDHGFWELGRFSVAYRSLFGESPAATLQRT